MQLKVKKHELRLLLQCIPILTFATLASLGSLLPSVVQCCSYFGGTGCFYIWH